ncbi:phosphatidylglycerol lysyltransferase domain-containing protein [Pelagovum pacificum]|uniref:phosphatidylglycerol lysyltransferase domain-containing protein n=1 Tax=Pelagovum pacificum TaxID=2588711 RepID=UPI001E5C5D79|nr:phosphatidylglycerol lysyltransferase domain-containing protein [Pelagovum pacificum]
MIGLALGAVLLRQLQGVDLADLLAALQQTGIGQLCGALLATAVSLVALGAYDVEIHATLGSDVGRGRARRAGWRAVAIGQVTGFGTLVGAMVRWRLLPDTSPARTLHVSTLVSLSFMVALLPLALIACLLWLPGIAPPLALLTAALSILAAVPAGLRKLRDHPRARKFLGRLDGPRFARLQLWTALDVGAAALALWFVITADGIPLGPVFAAYLVALGAGLLTNMPGGLGAFELALLALLPDIPQADLLAGILLFRALYHALPAMFAMRAVMRGGRPAVRSAGALRTEQLISAAPCAEWGLARQGALLYELHPGSAICTQTAPGILAVIGRSLGKMPLRALADLALQDGRRPVLYKCDARTAADARRAGWTVMRLAKEGRLDPSRHSTVGSACRQLRRKLRQADAAGVVCRTPVTLPLAEMADVAAEWAAQHGGERGFSMGRFEPGYVARQEVVIARDETGQLLGFVTFHAAPCGWTLDLMRHRADIPPGTMTALVHTAILAAKAAGCTRLSLAAVPDLPENLRGWKVLKAAGLTRFKATFAPSWTARYIAVRRPWDLPFALCSVAWQVHVGSGRDSLADAAGAETRDLEFDLPGAAWQQTAISPWSPSR